MSDARFIPVNEPLLGEREKELLAQCIDTGWISSDGAFVKQFEDMFAAYVGVKHGVAVCNGTAALEAAVAAAEIGPGDEVIMPTFTIISCALAVVERGGVPVLVDCEPGTWNMDVAQVEGKVTGKTKAIMPVHMYGHPADMDPLMEIARQHDLLVIEDAAEAHGAEYRGRKVGGFGDINCFSFYANKIITTGEGGMIVTNDDRLAGRARSQRNLCFGKRRFYHTELGHNFRMTNLQAAVGVAQMERVDEFVAIKRRNAGLYTERLSQVGGLSLPVEKGGAKSVYWMYGIVLDESTGMDAVDLAAKLGTAGIGTRPFFLGMHEQPVFRQMGLFAGGRYPVAERIARQGLYLPSGMTLTASDIETVCATVERGLA